MEKTKLYLLEENKRRCIWANTLNHRIYGRHFNYQFLNCLFVDGSVRALNYQDFVKENVFNP